MSTIINNYTPSGLRHLCFCDKCTLKKRRPYSKKEMLDDALGAFGVLAFLVIMLCIASMYGG